MILTIALCAALCALILIWVLKPLQRTKIYYALAFIAALLALNIYVMLGRPDLPAHPLRKTAAEKADDRQMAKYEFEFSARLEKNPDDLDALIRLAALRVVQKRDPAETRKLLDRAAALSPKDKRIGFIRASLDEGIP